MAEITPERRAWLLSQSRLLPKYPRHPQDVVPGDRRNGLLFLGWIATFALGILVGGLLW